MSSVIEDNDAKQKQIDELNAMLLLEQAKNAKKTTGNAAKRPKKDVDSATSILLRETIKEKVWREVKFVSSTKQMTALAQATCKLSGLEGKFTDDGKLTPEGADWVRTYEGTINKMLNDHRSYCQTAMKDVCTKMMKDYKLKELPTNEEFLKIIRRDEDVDMVLFEWWWDEYMPKACGSAKVWNKLTKYFGLMRSHHPPACNNKVYITPSTEAWGMLLIENCRDRWPKLMKLKEKNGDRIVYYTKAAPENKPGVQYVNVKEDQDFVGKYTDTESGQIQFGGWSNDGLKRYKELRQLNQQARDLPTTKNLENEILETLRKKHGITAHNWEDHKKNTKTGSEKKKAPEEVEDLFDISEIAGIEEV